MLSSRARRLAAVLSVAILAAGAAIAVSASSAPAPAPATVVADPATDLSGIPERRGVLGDPGAPLTLTEFVDPQCPVCAAASREVLPAVIEAVRRGDVRLDARVLSFLGPDSVTAARYAAAAREQDRLWPFLETFFANQGVENSGYVTEEFLAGVARAAGVDVSSVGETDDLDEANAEAQRLGVTGTPTFVLEDRSGRERIVPADRLAAELGA